MTFQTSYTQLSGNTSNVGNATVSQTSTFESVSALKISGGANTYVIATDGSGNLNWVNPAPTAVPAGVANAVQFNNFGAFDGDNVGFSFNSTTSTLSLTGTPAINVGNITSNISFSVTSNNGIDIQDGLAGQFLITNGSNAVEWSFGGNGIGYPNRFTSLSSFVTSNANAGANSVVVSPSVTIAPNSVVRFGNTLNLYEVASTSTTGSDTTINLSRSLAANVNVGQEIANVEIVTINQLYFQGAINPDYPSTVDPSIGNVKTLGSNAFITQNLHPNPNLSATTLTPIYNANSQFYANAVGISISDDVGTLNTTHLNVQNTLLVDDTLSIGNTGIAIQTTGTGNTPLNINVTNNDANGGSLYLNSDFIVNGELITPSDTAAVALPKNSERYQNYKLQKIISLRNTVVNNFWQDVSYENAGVTYDDSTGRFWNFTGSPLILIVNWQIMFESGATSQDGTNTGAKVTWLSMNGNNDKRYGMWDIEDTNYEYKIGALIIRSYYGPTSTPCSTLIKLTPGSYFEINVYANGIDSPGFPGTNWIGQNDPQPQRGARAAYDTVFGATVSARLGLTRLDQ